MPVAIPSKQDADEAVGPFKSKVLHRTVDHQPLFVAHAKGSYLYTEDGRQILDGCGGAAVVSVGHSQERITKALAEQLNTVSYLHSGAFANRPAEELAEMLTKSSGMERALFNCGGTEAMESAIKLVRQYHVERGHPERVNYIGRVQSYHGNSLGALSLCRHTIRRRPYLPLFNQNVFHEVSPCYAYRYKLEGESDEDYVARLKEELEAKFQELGPGTVAAFFAETIVGATSGCTPAVPGYFKAMKEVCEKHGALLVLDEIMCGMGRTGKMHAWQWEGVQPDVQVCGKALGGGYAPISAVLVSSKVVSAFREGSGAFNNGYTYQSHVIGCRAGVEVLKMMEELKLVEQCHERGVLLERLLHEKFDSHPNVGNIRGRGLFWAIELVKDKGTKEMFPKTHPITDIIAGDCLANGLVVYPGMKGTVDGLQGDHMLIAPPYIVTEEELRFLVDTLAVGVEAGLRAPIL
ncbi:adenosylmethionine-8-amino-7-oxononanoate aminotransferase [Naematelia encephala]|uniref:Adenosylmethionine-8-amino-7-oxononanoate aminotransferase n=1 Tax=Naematelia encephala TaxID=71784 RepID=A0A1Y2AWV7_9TREE|nr:adenosylmethionine-8-amino-7-oxononanoate aminotransferase [Naematelia encephala]